MPPTPDFSSDRALRMQPEAAFQHRDKGALDAILD